MKKKIIIGCIISTIIIGFVALSIARSSRNTASFGAGIEVRTGRIEKGSIASYISASGIVEETEKAEVFFDAAVKVEKILVQKNERVVKGEKIIELDLSDLKSQLDQARLNKSVQELAIKKLKATASGKDLAKLEASVHVAENDVKNARAAYDKSKKAYDDSKALYEAGAISKNELETSQNALTVAEIALNNAKLNYDIAVENLNIAKINYIKSSTGMEIDLDVQQKNLEGIMLNIKNLEEKISKIENLTRAPIDGVISELNVTEGAIVSNMQAAFKIINPDKLRILARVSEFNVKFVAEGQRAAIKGDSISKDEEIMGRVVSISPTAVRRMAGNGEETSIEVVISMEGTSKSLKPGFNVTCDIFTAEKDNILVAELGMFEEDKDGNKYAYVVDPENYVMHKKQVELGINSDLHVEVLEGLNEGDIVVIDPQPSFRDGQRVKIKGDMK